MPTAEEWRFDLECKLDQQIRDIQIYTDYYDGNHRMAFVTSKFREAFGEIFDTLVDNWCELIVDAPVERLGIEGFRFDGDESADAAAWKIWKANRMPSQSIMAHIEAVKCGNAYVMVSPGANGPRITVEHPAQMVVEYAAGDRTQRLAALKRWQGVDGYTYTTLYLPDMIHKWRSSSPTPLSPLSFGTTPVARLAARVRRSTVWEENPGGGRNPLGMVPVWELANNPTLLGGGRSDLLPAIPLQDAINKEIADMLIASEFAAFPQRVVTGIEVPTDEAGEPLEGFELKSAISRLWTFEDPETKISEFSAASLQNYVDAVTVLLQHMAAQTRTPPHYLLGQIVNAPLALDTVVPTPTGRTTIGEIGPGDTVFAPDGSPLDVLGVTPVFEDRDCYEVEFSDGETVVASADHLWETEHFTRPDVPYRHPREVSPVTTQEIADSLLTSMGKSNHAVLTAGAYDTPEADLPIDPYVFGVWLGDGCRVHGTITSHVDDHAEMKSLLESCGETVKVSSYPESDSLHRDCRTLKMVHDRALCPRGHEREQGTKVLTARCPPCANLHYRRKRYGEELPPAVNATFVSRLRDLGVWKDKHIPESYLLASPEQRRSLLQGLMDTDGTVNREQGSVAIQLANERLIRGVLRLIQSLGHKAALTRRDYEHAQFGWRVKWSIAWSAPEPVFRLNRKLALQRTDFPATTRRRYIRSVTPIPSVPVRCIEVDSEDHLFCVTDALIATRNSGDALKAAETGLVSKVKRKQVDFEDTWQEAMSAALQLSGSQPEASIETIWRDPEYRSEGETVDAAVKLKEIGIPFEALWERIGATPQQIERWAHLMNLPDRREFGDPDRKNNGATPESDAKSNARGNN